MKKRRIFWSIIMIIALLAGCGAKDGAAESDKMEDMVTEEAAPNEMLSEDVVMGGTSAQDTSLVADNRKIIQNVFMNVETKEFDALLGKVNAEISKQGGYIEKSVVSGNSYSYDGNRYAELVARIPADKSNGFSEFVSANSTVLNKEIGTDDVTLTYIDMESRVSALETEKEALENLLAKAEVLEEIIKIQERLTDVIYEIESYQSQLRVYDNLIEYTTITIHIQEVERETVLEEQTVWQEIRTKLSDNVGTLKDGAVNLFVFVISNIPYFVILGGVIIAGLVVVKRVKKKKEKE